MVVPLQVISLQPCSISCLSDNNLQKKTQKLHKIWNCEPVAATEALAKKVYSVKRNPRR